MTWNPKALPIAFVDLETTGGNASLDRITEIGIVEIGSEGVTQWSRPDSFENAWRRAVKNAGLSDLRFHDLRHEAASRLFERGPNPMQVAAITGHKTLQMLKRYTHLRVVDLVALLA